MTPSAIYHIGWRIFLMFGIFCVANGAFVFFFIKETKGRSLEEMDVLFGTVEAEQRAADVERILHKGAAQDEHVETVPQETKEVQPAAAAVEEKTVNE